LIKYFIPTPIIIRYNPQTPLYNPQISTPIALLFPSKTPHNPPQSPLRASPTPQHNMTDIETTTPTVDIRSSLLQKLSHSQQTLNYQLIGKYSLQLIRFYVRNSHYNLAQVFITNNTFPQNDQVDSQTYDFYMYYVALVAAIQLKYAESLSCLELIVRIGKNNEDITPFHLHVYRLYIIVSLLMGNIPDRTIFNIPLIATNLQPSYLSLTRAVRLGDLVLYNEIVTNDETIKQFVEDNTYNLILRLQPTIVRAGLRRIIDVYSNIALDRIAELLSLSQDDVHSIVSKAISDGVINASIDIDNVVHSSTSSVQYSSTVPQNDLIKKIQNVINLRQQCRQGLRYPDRVEEDDENAALLSKRGGGAFDLL